MKGNERRERLVEILKYSDMEISGSELAKQLGVTRQVVVHDIARLRAANNNILSTIKGYYLQKENNDMVRETFYVKHADDQMSDELCIIVDLGGRVCDVQVNHPIYGLICSPLCIHNRADVDAFVNEVQSRETMLLNQLTNGIHAHTVEAKDAVRLSMIKDALRKKNYLMIPDK